MKVCSKCDQGLDESEFHIHQGNGRLRPTCKRCHALQGYGLDRNSYDELLGLQAGVCGICGAPPPQSGVSLHVDHCHETGRVRGILCNNCNRALGMMGDDLDGVMRYAAYLAAHEAEWMGLVDA